MAIGPDGQVRRKCTGRLRIPGRAEPNSKELAASLREQFGEKSIAGMQAFGMGRFELFFATEGCLNRAVEQGFLFGNQKLDIEQADTPVKWLYVRYAPFELDREDFEQYLSQFGEVLSIEFVYPEEFKPWHNGERKIKFVMRKEVPNFLKIGIYTVQIRYAGVVSLCRRCHGSGHVARFCKSDKCRRCGGPGHLEAECTVEIRENLSPESQRIVIQARDDLLRNLRMEDRTRVLTSEKEASNEEGQGEEDDVEKEETRHADEEPEREDADSESESMPELESEDELEDTHEQMHLERIKYLKKKENENEGSLAANPKKAYRKKKMSKQEKKKKKQIDEMERNKKREREESKSPERDEPNTRKSLTDKVEENLERDRESNTERKKENYQSREKKTPETVRKKQQEEEESDSQEERKSKDKMSYVQQGSEKKNLEKMWMFFKEKRTLGEIKELISNKFEMGIIERIDEQPSGVWGVRLKERRWADQLYQTGFGEGEDTIYPMWWAEEADDGNLKKLYKRVSDSLPDGQNS